MRRFPRPLFLFALSLLAAAPGFAAPVEFPLPNGQRLVTDEHHVSPFLAAWKANALAKQREVARPMTANQEQWDARWYDLNLTFTPASSVSGTVRMKATVVAGPISTVELDFASALIHDAVTAGGVATTASHVGAILTVNLDRAYANGETVDVTVTYHGNPTVSGYFGFNTVNGRQLIWSLSEAYGARTWWPCKDAPEDKADSVSVHFTCPVACTTVSNGTLISRVVNAGGTTATTSWSERYPIATYLVSIASYPYTITDDWYRYTPTDSMLIRFHNYPESASGYAANQAKVKNMIATFATKVGQYPFLAEKYGHAQFQFSGGMEHQTCTSLGVNNESVMAHELFHQWFGDHVTCFDFHHIWLNEGFATYGEALWQEALGGTAAYFADIDADKYFGAGSVYVPDATDENRVFDANLSYDKGAWVLHMLRHVLGDATFFTALQTYQTTWGYQSATTENFRDVCAAVSGRNLDAFFNEWIYGEDYPIYAPTWSAVAAGGGWDVTLTLAQTQSWQLFDMPVDVTISTTGGDQTFVVPDSLASQQFVLHVATQPTALAIDANDWILKQLDLKVKNPTFQKPVLLVNGVDWATYGSEITNAYAAQAFSGSYPIDFWDNFATPAGGYPSPLPAPLGHGLVTPEVLGQYRNVIWVGNNFNGDLGDWQSTPILSYLRAGGNVLLMTREGDSFLGDSLRAYLGITWTNLNATLNDCIATRPGFTNMTLTSTQSLCAAFDTTALASPETQNLFRVSSGFSPSRGIGAIRVPANGAGFRPHGGRFAFLSGRPYRWNSSQLKSNVTQLLSSWFLEPLSGVAVEGGADLPRVLEFASPFPNPSSRAVDLTVRMPHAGRAQLVLIDVGGRRVRTLADWTLAAGSHRLSWDGRDDAGHVVRAGLYWARVDALGQRATQRLVRLP